MPISTNAPFNDLGHSMVLRDIEQLWLSLQDTDAALRGVSSGDMNGGGGANAGQDNLNDALGGPGSQLSNGDTAGGDLSGTYPDPTVAGLQGIPISGTVPLYGQTLVYDGAQYSPTTLSLPVVHYLGTLDVPVFNNGGNARGANSVDWQQARSLATQVASGASATILGGEQNTASGQYATAGGYRCAASAISSLALGQDAIASGNRACTFGGATASGADSLAAQGGVASATNTVAIGVAAVCGGNNSVVFNRGTISAGGLDSAIVACGAGGSVISAANCISIGTGHTLSHDNNSAFGSSATSTHTSDTHIGAGHDIYLNADLGGTGGKIISSADFWRGSTRLLTTQQAAITAPTGGATIDAQSRTAINTIIATLAAHGLTA